MRCKAIATSGQPCKAKPHKDGLCLFHSDPAKAAELGRKGGLRRQRTYDQSDEPVAPLESAADVKRMLAETMAGVLAGSLDPKIGSSVAYVATVLLRAYEVDPPPAADTPTQPYVPLIYRALTRKNGTEDPLDDVLDFKHRHTDRTASSRGAVQSTGAGGASDRSHICATQKGNRRRDHGPVASGRNAAC
jgi:hypothetical protein